ncbi:helix-turn-helix domain-containing protein [Streptomyces flaveus]|uniref:helix-turn-helix domain-containing protein n=1 Tax=Streptomyces flaveus TaxID=66370 RepID=UPI0033326BC3
MHVHQSPPPAPEPIPPFNAPVARRLRAALGMGPEHVAYGIRTSYGLPYVTPDLVAAWETGTAAPSNAELVALAGVLWCSPAELIGAPQTLREFRLARGAPAEDVARAVGLELPVYLRMEENNEWRGNERQSTALAEVLGLALPDLVTVRGRRPKLAELLRNACSTRWQAYVRPVSKLLPLDRWLVEDVLESLYTEYQLQMAPTLSWGNGTVAVEAGDVGRDFLDQVVDHFWSKVQRHAP